VLFIATRISFINFYDAILIEILGLKPYCSSTSMLFMHICMSNLLKISFSKTLEKEVGKDVGL
jgi:hypothetical protein